MGKGLLETGQITQGYLVISFLPVYYRSYLLKPPFSRRELSYDRCLDTGPSRVTRCTLKRYRVVPIVSHVVPCSRSVQYQSDGK